MWFALAVLGIRLGTPPIGEWSDARTAPFHPNIHNLGNVGFWGSVHAKGAWVATCMIDRMAYSGRHMRRELAAALAEEYGDRDTTVLEVGCGVGTLTVELDRIPTFNVTAIDTSQEMLDVARTCTQCRLLCMNAIDVGEPTDVSVVCMTMHEMPPAAHEAVVEALLRTTRRSIWIADIDPSYVPSQLMLSGEPYVPTYLDSFEKTIERVAGVNVRSIALVPGHVRVWKLDVS